MEPRDAGHVPTPQRATRDWSGVLGSVMGVLFLIVVLFILLDGPLIPFEWKKANPWFASVPKVLWLLLGVSFALTGYLISTQRAHVQRLARYSSDPIRGGAFLAAYGVGMIVTGVGGLLHWDGVYIFTIVWFIGMGPLFVVVHVLSRRSSRAESIDVGEK